MINNTAERQTGQRVRNSIPGKGHVEYQRWYLPGVVALFAASPSAVTFMNIWREKKKNFQALNI